MDSDQQPLLAKDDGLERLIADLAVLVKKVGLTGDQMQDERKSLYKRAYDYCIVSPDNRTIYLYNGCDDIAQKYLDDIIIDEQTLPSALKGAELALQTAGNVGMNIIRVRDYPLMRLPARVKSMFEAKKKQCCDELGWSMEHLRQKINAASYIGLPTDEAVLTSASDTHMKMGGMEIDDIETGSPGLEQHNIANSQRAPTWRVACIGIGAAGYGLTIIATTMQGSGSYDWYAIVLLAISRALWMFVIAANQGTEGDAHFKHSISAILADKKLQNSILLHSILFLTGISFGMAFIQGKKETNLGTKLSGLLIFLSFFGILVCPISRDNVDVELKQRLHWGMLLVLALSFLSLAIWNWVGWYNIEKVCCIVTGTAFGVFFLFNAWNKRQFHPWIRWFVEHRIWIEVVAMELVFVVTFWTLCGIVL